ncbi:protein cueball [Diorhabda carinulata]|uniref:protein cueball n=1 Tax=Diorhabda carinulata TaxID=1163345 RepID=UPI0025A0C3F2|nr:protein cueball [Diorhabda carinulata]
MLIKLSVILILVKIFHVKGNQLDWDLAIVVDNEIQLLTSNGTLIDSRSPFSLLKAITYDGVRDQFIVSDRDTKNDTIFTVRLSKETETEPIMKGPPGDVQGLAIDPLDDVLYWSNAINHTINYISLNDSTHDSKEFILFKDVVPHAIAIDVCNRYIYYTNPSGSKPTIERRKLDNSHHQILVDDTIMTPVGLAIDYKEQRLYWADSRIGTVAGRIESISLDGKDRKLIAERTTMEPFGLAVDEDAIYWTDTNNNGLYKLLKSETNPYADPQKITSFSDIPMGLVANAYMKDDCEILPELIQQYQESKKQTTTAQTVEESLVCLNGGSVKDKKCDCKPGYTGNYCEIPICSSAYCLNGNCYLSSSGKPMCSCKKGYIGNRCQKNKCDYYCLNEGKCAITPPRNEPKCECLDGFIGNRCEYNQQTCDFYCNAKENTAYSAEFEYMCRCSFMYSEKNASALLSRLQERPSILSKFQDPVIYLSALVLFCMLVIVALFIYIHNVHKKRPRIKKRIIVNKNVTPLTFRPQPNTEQCEITIENCCNMNVCETPCFEPTGEDKKKLLMNMEGEDIY